MTEYTYRYDWSGSIRRSDGRYRLIDPISYGFLKRDGLTNEQIYNRVAVPPEQVGR